MSTRLNNRAFVALGVVALLAAVTLAFAGAARAHGTEDITFPVAELGGCTSRDACKAYCSDSANRTACHAFAVSHSLKVAASTADGSKLRVLLKADGGPGGCAIGATDPKTACRAYCDSRENIDVCVAYGRSHNLFTGERLNEIRKIELRRLLPGHASTTASTTRPALENGKLRAEFHKASTTNVGSTTRPVRPIPPHRPRLENASSTSFGDFLLLRVSGLASAFAALLR